MNTFATRKRNIFDPSSKKPFELSRSKIELFLSCPRCFYLDRRLGVAPPRGFPFNLNEAVDILLKKEFDIYRQKQEPHPLVSAAGLSLTPFQHAKLEEWRNPFIGVRYMHPESNFLVFGGVDDVWVDDEGRLTVVDYKATSKEGEITLNEEWKRSYKNQLEIYQWLFSNNEFSVSSTGYFVYANALRDTATFEDTLHFATVLLPYTGKTDWIDQVLVDARKVLSEDTIPPMGTWCNFCPYREAAGGSFREHMGK